MQLLVLTTLDLAAAAATTAAAADDAVMAAAAAAAPRSGSGALGDKISGGNVLAGYI